MKKNLVLMAMLFSAVSAFTQEEMISNWGYGLETSSGILSGDGLFSTYSVSIQGIHDAGFGLSLDYIKGLDVDEWVDGVHHQSSGLLVNSGLLGSVFLGLPLSKYFIPYVGGGLGVKFNEEDVGFAWKVDAGIISWPINILYVKAGVSYDNIREDLGVSVGVGFKFTKNVTARYINSDGSTFTRSFSGLFNAKAPSTLTEDTFLQSEIVSTNREIQTKTYRNPGYPVIDGSGSINDGSIGGISSTPGRTYQIIETYEVTVTRHWYNRTTYYQNQKPTYSKVYKDEETRRLINTETKYLN